MLAHFLKCAQGVPYQEEDQVELQHLQHHEERRAPVPRAQVALQRQQQRENADRIVRGDSRVHRARLPQLQPVLESQLHHHAHEDHDNQHVVVANIQRPFARKRVAHFDLRRQQHRNHQDIHAEIHTGYRGPENKHADRERRRDAVVADVQVLSKQKEAAAENEHGENGRLETAFRDFTAADPALRAKKEGHRCLLSLIGVRRPAARADMRQGERRERAVPAQRQPSRNGTTCGGSSRLHHSNSNSSNSDGAWFRAR